MRISDWSSDVCSSDLQGPEQCFTQPVSRYGGQEAPWQDAVRIDIFNGKRRRNSGKPIKALQHAKSLASTIAPAKAAAAAIGGDMRWVRPPGPCRPSKFRFRSEEHTSELQSLMRISYA